MSFQSFFVILILTTVSLNTLAQTLLKLGAGQSIVNPYLIGGILAYGLSTVFYIAVLGKFNLSVAYPIVIGLTVISATIAGAIFLQEKVSFSQWMGIGLMSSGLFAIMLAK